MLPPHARMQRSAVKVAYARNKSPGQWRQHGLYLEREGAQREGERGHGFTAADLAERYAESGRAHDEDRVRVSSVLDRWQEDGDPRLWKMIVSPEAGSEIDLREHTRRLAGCMERDLGTKLEWVAVDHYNTDNPHVHLLVRGVDRDGRELEIDPNYIRRGIRQRSREIATAQRGLRLDREILARRERAVEQRRFTEIDRELIRSAGPSREITFTQPPPADPRARALRLQRIRRLAVLEGMGLAEKTGALTWRLSDALEPALRQYQLSFDVIRRSAAHQHAIEDPRAPLVAHTKLEPGERITGRVVGAGLDDELYDRRYLLIEGADGRVHYVHQPRNVQRAREQGRLRTGEIVTLEGGEFRAGGRAIRFARLREHGALEEMRARAASQLDIDVVRHVRETGELPRPHDGLAGFAARYRGAMVERVPRLFARGVLRRDGGAISIDEEAMRKLVREARQLEGDRMETLDQVRERVPGKALDVAAHKPGARYTGTVVATAAADAQGTPHVVLDTGRRLVAFPGVGEEMRVGRRVRAIAETQERMRLRLWRFADLERERAKERRRGRARGMF